MSNWGSSKKSTPASRVRLVEGVDVRRARSPRHRRTQHRRRRHRNRSRGRPESSGNVRDATPPDEQASRRTRANTEMREAVAGREHEFLGLGLIGLGVLLGLAIYVNLAGPLGRGIETLFGWLTGLGRYAVPVVLVAIGVSLVRRGRTYSPFRLAVGWTMVGGAALGLLQIVRGPDDVTDGRRAARRGRWMARRVDRRSPRSAARPCRSRPGARARPDRWRAADHPDLDAHHGVAHRRISGHHGQADHALDQVGPQQRHHAEQRPEPWSGRVGRR